MLQLLKTEVELKFGSKISYQKDCNSLSDNIFTTQREYISPATLRRVFGFLATNSNPSRVTLDILSRYVGFKSWEEFNLRSLKTKQNTKHSLIEQWNIIQENSKTISSNTVEHIKIKSGIDFEKTAKRQFIKDRINSFANDDSYSATAIIAPGGYGKSTLLALWYLTHIRKEKKGGDVILFISAQMLDQFAPTEVFIETWLMRLLGLKPDNNFLNDIVAENIKTPGKLIIIIDALDEITSQGARQEKIFKSLGELACKFSKTNVLKLIVSTRLSTWKLFASHFDSRCWYFTNTDLFTSDGANIPPLNFEEIQIILDNTLNRKYELRTLAHEMHPDLRSIISYPYFLQLFIQVYTPENNHLLSDQVAILSEFLKKQVYYAQYSDEKIDILNQIIVLSEYGNKYALKDDLKSIYPIHLKLSGNYYNAYEELNSYGIITEETQVDTFGGYFKYIKVANHQLLCMLIVQNLIRKQKGINQSLLQWIDQHLAGAEIQGTVLGIVFKVAYKERLSIPLENFFDLSNLSLNAAFSIPTIPATFRTDNFMRNELIPRYAIHKKARKFLFEKSIDYNHMVDSYSTLLKEYLNNSELEPEKLFANTLLAYIGLISMDTPLAINHFNNSEKGNPALLSPNIAGLWFTNSILHKYLFENSNPDGLIDKAIKFRETYKSAHDKAEFGETVMPSILLMKRYEYILNFIEPNDTLAAPNHQSAMCFLSTKVYRLMHENKPINTNDNSTVEQIYGLLNPLNNYTGIIIGEILRANYFMNCNNLEETYRSTRNAIELSSAARYKLVEIVLMKNLANTLDQLGEQQRAAECMNYVKSMWKTSGFKRDII